LPHLNWPIISGTMPTEKDLHEELNFLTEKISTLVWTLNVGTLATTWSPLVTNSMPDHVRFSVRNAFWVFLLCFLALASELGQYMAGYWQARSHRNEMENTGRKTFAYVKTDFRYRMRENCASS
jgi:hypothetical protein